MDISDTLAPNSDQLDAVDLIGQRPVDRFAEKVALTESGCLVWIAALTGNGYGSFWHDGRNVPAHRWSYEYHRGPIPDGLHLDHLCRTRDCVLPDHLEPVTCRENILRGEGSAAARSKVTHCPAEHPLAGANLYVPPKRPQERHCRACRIEAARRHRSRVRARQLQEAGN